MPPVSDPELLVLHALRLKGAAAPEAVAERFGLPLPRAAELIGDCEARGWVREVEFAGGGWMLTPTGRVEGVRRLAAELDATGARPVVEAAHAAFVPLNGRVLDTIRDWQLRPAPAAPGSPASGRLVPNDHLDRAWDARVVRELEELDAAVRPVLASLAAVLDRFVGYGPRLAGALARVRAGGGEWVDRPVMDSFHTVWFELHEDLLATLGLERGAVPAAPDAASDDPTAERAS